MFRSFVGLLLFVICGVIGCNRPPPQVPADTPTPAPAAVASPEREPTMAATNVPAATPTPPAIATPVPTSTAAVVVTTAAEESDILEVGQLTIEVVNRYPHDTSAFTQGLLWHNGKLYESVGQYGRSDVRRVDLVSGEVEAAARLGDAYFAEGLTLVGDRLVQLTWNEEVAFVYDVNTLELVEAFSYSGPGWGLCYDGESLWMSDGSQRLYQRDPQTFRLLNVIEVTLNQAPVNQINELECVGGTAYANVWRSDMIIQIDLATGRVINTINAAQLLPAEARGVLNGDDVLNGIAYVPESGHFLLTGKRWPVLFEVKFSP